MFRGKVNEFVFSAEKGCHGVFVVGVADDSQFVAPVDHRVGPGACDCPLVQDARANKGAAHDAAYATDTQAAERFVGHFHVKVNRRLGRVFFGLLPELRFFFDVDAENEADDNGRHNDAHNPEGIGAGVAHGNVFALVAEHVKGFLRCSEARRVCHGSVVHAEHLRKTHRV